MSSDEESMLSGGGASRRNMPPPTPPFGSGRGGRSNDDEIPETPPAGASPSASHNLEPPETPPTPRSTQTELDSVAQGNNDAAAEQLQQMEAEEEAADEPAAPLLGTYNEAHIRGTDVHVPTAAAAFTDFLRNFVSSVISSVCFRGPICYNITPQPIYI